MKKLVSLNFSMKLLVKDGKQERDVRFTGVLPSKAFQSVDEMIKALCEFVNDELDTKFHVRHIGDMKVSLLKPKRISRPVVDTEKNIKELVG